MTDFLSKCKHPIIISGKYNVHHTTVPIYIVLSSYTLPKEDYLLSNNENLQYINDLQIVALKTTIIHIVLFIYMIKISIFRS